MGTLRVFLMVIQGRGGGIIALSSTPEQNLQDYHQTSNMIRTLVGDTFFYHSDEVEASPFSAAPTTSSFLT